MNNSWLLPFRKSGRNLACFCASSFSLFSEYSKVLFLFFPPLAAFWVKTKAAGVAGTKYGTASY